MANTTVRIPPILNDNLEKVSYQTGIPKSSLILYALNDRLRLNKSFQGFEYIPIDTDNSIRFTLRMPDHLKALLQEKSLENNISTNQLINECVYHFYVLYWQEYL